MNDELVSLLTDLGNFIVEYAENRRNEGERVKRTYKVTKPKVQKFDEKRFFPTSTRYEEIDKEHWHWRDITQFVKNTQLSYLRYRDCITALINDYDFSEHEARIRLTLFIHKLAGQLAFHEQVMPSYIPKFINAYICELNGDNVI
jgi:hypothetical protein